MSASSLVEKTKQVLKSARFEKEALIQKILALRARISLPTDEHTLQFMRQADYQEVVEIFQGLEELVRIFENYGTRTFAAVIT